MAVEHDGMAYRKQLADYVDQGSQTQISVGFCNVKRLIEVTEWSESTIHAESV